MVRLVFAWAESLGGASTLIRPTKAVAVGPWPRDHCRFDQSMCLPERQVNVPSHTQVPADSVVERWMILEVHGGSKCPKARQLALRQGFLGQTC